MSSEQLDFWVIFAVNIGAEVLTFPTQLHPRKNIGWIPKMMGFGKGDSGFTYGQLKGIDSLHFWGVYKSIIS